MTKHIVSTLSADTRYTKWITTAGLNTVGRSVLVRGGAGIASRGGGHQIVTPGGVRTEVSDDDARFLSEHEQFQDHQKRGHVRILNTATDPEKSAQSMERDPGSAPKTPADVEKAKSPRQQDVEKTTVTTNKK